MATVSKWTPFGVALDLTATGGTVTRTSATQYTVKINVSWETYYSGAQTNYGMTAASGGVTHTISAFNGTKRSSGSGTFTGTYSISGNGSATKTITVTFKNFNTDNGDNASKSVSFTVNVPAWTSYTIKYNANGGSGAPSSQTKWKDQTLKLSTTKPTRTGYSFLGWSTSSSATSATYAAGANYTANAAATLYAVWKANTYTVSYNANGGTGAPGSQTKTYGVSLTLSSTKPTRTNYNFKGWGTSASATTVAYTPGASYTTNSAITLYAVWELAYTKPRINNYSVGRCTSNGTTSDEGTYALVKFSWATDRDVTSIVVEWLSGSTVVGSKTISATGKSGSVNTVVGNGGLSIESTYMIKVTVKDTESTSESITLSGRKFVIDALAGGKGVSFGKPAELEGYADFGWDAVFDNYLGVHGRDLDGNIKLAFQPQNENGNTVIGWGNYDKASGNTNLYGHDVMIGVSNLAAKDTYKPYIRRGDSFNVTVQTSGYVTNAGKDISFFVSLSRPVIGTPTVTATSRDGFRLRQNNAYTHGSSASTYVVPTKYSVSNYWTYGVMITASFTDTTNVINNNAIGIQWIGTLTFA